MRVPGWEGRLAAYIEAAQTEPFAWGSHDCALWAATWVQICTGGDYVSDWRGKYKTEAGAARLMLKRGYAGVEAIADDHLEEKPVRLAMRGDLVLHPSGALGICHGLRSLFVTADGLIAEKTLACPHAWGVG